MNCPWVSPASPTPRTSSTLQFHVVCADSNETNSKVFRVTWSRNSCIPRFDHKRTMITGNRRNCFRQQQSRKYSIHEIHLLRAIEFRSVLSEVLKLYIIARCKHIYSKNYIANFITISIYKKTENLNLIECLNFDL